MAADGFADDNALPTSGGSMIGPLTLGGSPPLVIPAGAQSGYVATSDASGNVSWAAPSGGGSGGGISPPAGDLGGTTSSPTVLATHLSSPLPVAQGGTGQATQQAALNALTGTQTAGTYLRSNGTNATLSAVQAADLPAKRVTTLTASSATYTPNCATTDIALIVTPTANFTVANPSGTPSDGQSLTIRILSGSTAYTPSWGTAYSGSTAVPLPSSCTASATDYLGFQWNAAAGRFHLLSYAPGY